MEKKIRIAVITAQMNLILRIMEDLVQIDGTTLVHLKYLTEYEDLRSERAELLTTEKTAAAA